MKISKELKESATLKFSAAARALKAQGKEIISLGLGEPTFETPDIIKNSTIDALNAGFTKYSNPAGLDDLRKLIKEKLETENNIQTEISNIIVTPGAKQAAYLAFMAILQPGNEVINITPCYVSYIPQIKLAEPDAKIINIDLNKDFTLDLNKIKQAITPKTKLLVLNTPNNPTGKIFSKEELQTIADLAIQHDFYILSDEIYEKLIFTQPHISIASLEGMKDRTITVNGFSKSFAMTGWRIGYLVANDDLAKTIFKIQQHTNTNTCTFIQKGVCSAFNLPKDYLNNYKKQLQNNIQILNENLDIIQPQGGMFAFLNISKTGLTSDQFATKLLEETSVALTPGISFGENWNDYVRISLVPDTPTFEKGIKLIKEFMQ